MRVIHITMPEVVAVIIAIAVIALLVYFTLAENMTSAPRLTPNCACKEVPGELAARINPMYWPDSGATCTPLFSPTTPDHVEMI